MFLKLRGQPLGRSHTHGKAHIPRVGRPTKATRVVPLPSNQTVFTVQRSGAVGLIFQTGASCVPPLLVLVLSERCQALRAYFRLYYEHSRLQKLASNPRPKWYPPRIARADAIRHVMTALSRMRQDDYVFVHVGGIRVYGSATIMCACASGKAYLDPGLVQACTRRHK